MVNSLHKCIQNFGPAPRNFSLIDRLWYLRVPKPRWLRFNRSDELTPLFQHLPALFREGQVVWGRVIQANNALFEEGDFDAPGELVYSLDDAASIDLDYLNNVGDTLFSLKGTQSNDPELAQISDYLADEMTRVHGLPVPAAISPSIRCQISTTYFVRKHLPGRRLCSCLLPIIVYPRTPHVAIPLPEQYWPDSLKNWWSHPEM